jgi:cytochrome oxidase Cu insertion factor (SCO1/SenC/PrrC family)
MKMDRHSLRCCSARVLLILLAGCAGSESVQKSNPVNSEGERHPLASVVGFQVGMEAPDFEGRDQNGDLLRLSAFRGNIVLVDFWGFW